MIRSLKARQRDAILSGKQSSTGVKGRPGMTMVRDSALLYAGRPLSYWAQRVNQTIREAELEGSTVAWHLRSSGRLPSPISSRP